MKELKVGKSTDISQYPNKEEINIIACHRTYKTRPFYITPVYSVEKDMMMKGLVEIPESVVKRSDFSIDEGMNYPINNNDRLVLYKNDKDEYFVNKHFLLYNLLLVVPEVAESSSKIKQGTSYFYIDNPEQEAVSKISIKRLIRKANSYIENSTTEDWVDMLYYFGKNPMDMTKNIIESKVNDLCDEKPMEVVSYFENKTKSERTVFVKKCLSYKLLTKDRNGYIMYDNTSIGFGEDAAANFLYEEQNDKIFSALRGALDFKTGK